MRQRIIMSFIIAAALGQIMFAQEADKAASPKMPPAKQEMAQHDEAAGMMMPAPLNNDPWMKWLAGEWEGTTESPMGTSKDWMKLEFALDGQFLIAHLKSETVTVNKEMAMQMGMTEEQMKAPYYGMGVFTIDPRTGESVDYWFDSMRGISSGKGKREGNVETTHWESAMGSEVRTLEKKGENDMVMTFKMTMPGSDAAMEGKTVLKRKK